jgi:hypothetical protein
MSLGPGSVLELSALPEPRPRREAGYRAARAARRVRKPHSDVDGQLAQLIIFLIPLRKLAVSGHSRLNLGIVLALLIAPVLISAARRYRGGSAVLLGFAFAAVSGRLLAGLTMHGSTGRAIDSTNQQALTLLIVDAAALFGCVLWARQRVSAHRIIAWYALGLFVNGVFDHSAWDGNALKYVFLLPTALLVLGALARYRQVASAVALVVLAGAAVAADYRSFAAFCALSLVLLGWRAMGAKHGDNQRPARAILAAVLLGYALYVAGSYAALHGGLGSEIQARTQSQAQHNQSQLVAGRPEWAATWSLFAQRPQGFGAGIVPDANDIAVAKAGLASVGSVTSGPYVDGYLFNGHIELHSLVGDLWLNFGLAGALLAIGGGVLLIRGLGRQLVSSRPSAPVVLLLVGCLWNIAFSPIDSALLITVLGCALVLSPRSARPAERHGA